MLACQRRLHQPALRRTLPALALAALGALALWAAPARAQNVGPAFTVNVGGLPPGLSVNLHVRVKFCNVSATFGPEAVVTMAEDSVVTWARTGLPFGPALRQVVHTFYKATVQPVIDSPFAPPFNLCTPSNTPTGTNVRFEASVAGATPAGAPDQRRNLVGEARLDTGPFELNPRFALTTIQRNSSPIVRNQSFSVDVGATGLGLQAMKPTVSFFEPVRNGVFTTRRLLARLFSNEAGRTCIASFSSTVCEGQGPLSANGVELAFISPSRNAGFASSFRLKLTNAFPNTPVTMESGWALADTMLPLVDGDATAGLVLVQHTPLATSFTLP